MPNSVPVNAKSKTVSSASSGTKRKRGEPRFYAVRTGNKPGVYMTWHECQQQTTGFKNASYKSFSTYTDAEKFVAGENPTSSGEQRFYAVKRGRVPDIYTDWARAQDQITGFPKPAYKAFGTREEARRWLEDGEGDTLTTDPPTLEHSLTSLLAANAKMDSAEQPPLKTRKPPATSKARARPVLPEYNEELYDAGFGPLPPGAVDGFDPNVRLDDNGMLVYKSQSERQATRLVPVDDPTQPVRIYTDGSSIKNGQQGALAGIGVYFGPGDRRNISEPLAGPRQTNQRAELTAVQRAIEFCPRNRNVVIVSDSKYAIQCLTEWFQSWRRNGWKTSNGKAVENRDLIESILLKIEERERLRVRTNFEWVKGHAAAEGNIEADRLAVNGSKMNVAKQELVG